MVTAAVPLDASRRPLAAFWRRFPPHSTGHDDGQYPGWGVVRSREVTRPEVRPGSGGGDSRTIFGRLGPEESLNCEYDFLDPLFAFAPTLLDGFADAVSDVVVE